MKKMILIASLLAGIFVSCTKDPVEPELPPPGNPAMRYFEFNNYSVRYGERGLALDLDEDGAIDGFFSVQLVGDPINRVDKRQWLVVTDEHIRLPVNFIEQAPLLNRSEQIPLANFNGFQWWGLTEISLIERAEFENGSVIWRGNWQQAVKAYLPVQVLKNGLRYNGWFEISTDIPGQRVIVHRAAVSKEAEKTVLAGL